MSLLTDIVSYWKLDSTTWVIAYDSVGSNHLTVYWACSRTTGVINNCIRQPWADNYLLWNIPVSTLVNWVDGFSFNCRLKDIEVQESMWAGTGIFKASWNNRTDQVKLLYENGSYLPNYECLTGWTPVTLVDTRTSVLWAWPVMVTFVISAGGTEIKIYQNGVLTRHDVWYATQNTIATTWWVLLWYDNYDGGAWRFIKGKYDEVWLRGRPLTDSEILKLYNGWKWLSYPFLRRTTRRINNSGL